VELASDSWTTPWSRGTSSLGRIDPQGLGSEHHSEQDRPAEIDGILGDHVSTKTLDDLVEYAVVVAQQNLLETENPAGSSETDSVSAHSE
jgi:hypothetical protein